MFLHHHRAQFPFPNNYTIPGMELSSMKLSSMELSSMKLSGIELFSMELLIAG